MADIFISYSSKDRAQAEQLIELLASAGLSVWIDKTSIDVSTSWSKEIVEAINECKAFVVLLSSSSIGSRNVQKEVALASEKGKKILPLDLEPVSLTSEFEYQLAGIQRTAMTNIDSIIRALSKLGLSATAKPSITLVKELDARKSLMILPFEDLSPTGDNGWFADGIVSELISALSNVKALRIIDNQATKEFKSYHGQLTAYAREMSIRYFVQGDVRKFGDTIKITSRLLDIETGDHLWQDSLRGTMDDIFDIQEKVAENVVAGLKVHLASDEKQQLSKRSTENSEAYELFLKAYEYYSRHTKDDYERAIELFSHAVKLDPNFAVAHAQMSIALEALYRQFSRLPALLERADQEAEQIRLIEGRTPLYLWCKSNVLICMGDYESALLFAKECVEIDPQYSRGYTSLGFAYEAKGDIQAAINALKEYVRLKENETHGHMNLLLAINGLHGSPSYRDELREAAEKALPVFERFARLNPDDYNALAEYSAVLLMADRADEALRLADRLSAIETLDAGVTYNLGWIYLKAMDTARGIALLQRSINKGFLDIVAFQTDPTFAPFRATPEFQELMKELQAKIATTTSG